MEAFFFLPKDPGKSSGSCITQEGRDDAEPELSSALLITELTVKNKSTECNRKSFNEAAC